MSFAVVQIVAAVFAGCEWNSCFGDVHKTIYLLSSIPLLSHKKTWGYLRIFHILILYL